VVESGTRHASLPTLPCGTAVGVPASPRSSRTGLDQSCPLLLAGLGIVALISTLWGVWGTGGVDQVPAGERNSPGLKLGLNQATAAELRQLPTIGRELAAAIIQFRESKGEILSWQDLEEVPGIGPVRVQLLRQYLVILEGGEVKASDRQSIQKNDRTVSIAGALSTGRGSTQGDP
jgi:competence ComEA-like helix-hairpin-helix protein